MLQLMMLLWWLGIAARIVLLATLYWRGLLWKHWGLSLLLAGSLIRSGALAILHLSCMFAERREFQIRTEPLMIALYCIAALSAFWSLGKDFRFGWFGWVFSGSFALIGALACLGLSPLAQHPSATGLAVQLSRKHFSLCCAVFVVVTIWFLSRHQFLSLRQNVRVHLRVLLLFFIGEALAAAIGYSGTRWMLPLASVLSTGVPTLCFILWTVALRRAGEYLESRPAPQPGECKAAVERAHLTLDGLLAVRHGALASDCRDDG